jgi:hypothetical protein
MYRPSLVCPHVFSYTHSHDIVIFIYGYAWGWLGPDIKNITNMCQHRQGVRGANPLTRGRIPQKTVGVRWG